MAIAEYWGEDWECLLNEQTLIDKDKPYFRVRIIHIKDPDFSDNGKNPLMLEFSVRIPKKYK